MGLAGGTAARKAGDTGTAVAEAEAVGTAGVVVWIGWAGAVLTLVGAVAAVEVVLSEEAGRTFAVHLKL